MSKAELRRPEPEVAQIYETKRGNVYQILYVDEQVVLLRDTEEGRDGNNIHRVERRTTFEAEVESGKFEHQPDSDLDMMNFSEIDWSDVSYIGEKTSENLHDAGFKTNLDIQQADDDELLDVDGLGKGGLKNLKEYAL